MKEKKEPQNEKTGGRKSKELRRNGEKKDKELEEKETGGKIPY
jgi:hypothetical protein